MSRAALSREWKLHIRTHRSNNEYQSDHAVALAWWAELGHKQNEAFIFFVGILAMAI